MRDAPATHGPKLLPHPITTLILIAVWVLLHENVKPWTLFGGLVVGIGTPIFTAPFWPERPKVRSVGALIRFVPVFLWDIVVANLHVAWLVVNPWRSIHPQWIVVPLEITDPHAIVTLANVISLTPGTVSSEVGPDHETLLVHCLDAEDPEEAVAFIKRRYEAPIREIFE